ncbi:MAG: dihydroorotate dehydrogenase electron transfer subunit [Candidatus Altarchaeum sp. CG03_land_8_20_14_0_80_32_618]|nr:MAG: dihydroorotate dehydrogenase electron transfer subunit [Candidatus Altarchaeum sp. CG03_land_8_20_14_0_80_32_618]
MGIILILFFIEMFAKIIAKRTENENRTIATLKFDNGFNQELNVQPGQCLMIWIPGINEKPFSVSKISDDHCEVTIAKVGNFTENLINKGINDNVGIRGPFGRGFKITKEKEILIVAGGVGLAPLAQLPEMNKDKNFTCAVGAKTKKDLFFIERLKTNKNTSVFISTDDGSDGFKGFVTGLAEDIIKDRISSTNHKFDLIIACGRKEMLKEVYKISKKYNICLQISADAFMKCGIGICGSCAAGKFLVCKDGPVFMNEDIDYVMNFM